MMQQLSIIATVPALFVQRCPQPVCSQLPVAWLCSRNQLRCCVLLTSAAQAAEEGDHCPAAVGLHANRWHCPKPQGHDQLPHVSGMLYSHVLIAALWQQRALAGRGFVTPICCCAHAYASMQPYPAAAAANWKVVCKLEKQK
jgi:hypothetical protein